MCLRRELRTSIIGRYVLGICSQPTIPLSTCNRHYQVFRKGNTMRVAQPVYIHPTGNLSFHIFLRIPLSLRNDGRSGSMQKTNKIGYRYRPSDAKTDSLRGGNNWVSWKPHAPSPSFIRISKHHTTFVTEQDQKGCPE